jgi:hypothetical protein
MEEKLRVFCAELEAQKAEIEKIYVIIEGRVKSLRVDMKNEDLTISLAYRLHNLYSSYEDMFKLIAGFFENQIDDLPRYRADLLKRMRLDIEGYRPRLISEDSFKILDELRGFRHVFRHAYNYQLEPERIVILTERTLRLKDIFWKDFEKFLEKLR